MAILILSLTISLDATFISAPKESLTSTSLRLVLKLVRKFV